MMSGLKLKCANGTVGWRFSLKRDQEFNPWAFSKSQQFADTAWPGDLPSQPSLCLPARGILFVAVTSPQNRWGSKARRAPTDG